MKRFLRALDLQDLQLVSGIGMFGYGLFLVYPPAALITIGFLFIAPIIMPAFLSIWRAK